MNGTDREHDVFSIEEVLKEEVEAIHGATLDLQVDSQPDEERRKKLNADQRLTFGAPSKVVKSHPEFYAELNHLNRAALCCSGGGIRSATFCLGVIQALAGHDVGSPTPTAKVVRPPNAGTGAAGHAPAPGAQPDSESKKVAALRNSALGCFHYLSTVSGGGYIGSWLSSWRKRENYETVIEDLTGRPKGPDVEPASVSWLRAYSNYLTPTLGITSADSWAAVAICARNLILNWFVIIPVVCLVLLTLKLIATGSVWIAHGDPAQSGPVHIVLAAGIFFLIIAQAFTTRHRPSRRSPNDGVGEARFVWCDVLFAALSAMAVTIFFSSRYFWSQLDATQLDDDGIVQWLGVSAKISLPVVAAGAGFVIYGAGWIAGYVFGWIRGYPMIGSQKWSDLFRWAASGLVYGALVGLGAYLFALLGPYPETLKNIRCLLVSAIFGVPWVVMAQLLAEIVFVGLTSYEDDSDSDREWLGRAGGWLAAFAVVWGVTAFLVFAGGYLVEYATVLGHQTLVKAGGIAGIISGIFTALLGSSSKTPAKPSSKDQTSWTTWAYNIVLAVAGPIFVAVLIIVLSVIIDKLLLDDALVRILQIGKIPALCSAVLWLGFGWAISFVVELIASCFVNINRFSLHALYRNRLIRAYLGASNQKRDPDVFDGFDFGDNVCVHELWPPASGGRVTSHSLFHVVNIALNVVSTKRLAWQERKAEPFTVSPKHCGSAYLGFRRSTVYGGDGGLSLGTAMAISGAAASPNMGYNSSPSLALLLTLFNVRLGWWLGNPGEKGNKTYRKEGPRFAARPLFDEAFGQTTDVSPYVYLSDGGHFDNLGLYEMVRRRCRFIVVIDSGCDPDFAFEDLGNAVRKIYIDLGIQITFKKKGLDSLKTRPSAKSYSRTVRDAAALAAVRAYDSADKGSKPDEPGETPYYAIGKIDYIHADLPAEPDKTATPEGATKPKRAAKPVENGCIVYIKPAYHGTEGAGIRSYATANPDFPHETTLDQWFTESQFESYRSLGREIGQKVLGENDVQNIIRDFLAHTPPGGAP
jgi:hypothetical protein